ncbi:zinc finger protein 705F-like isoform X2 [Protopterus annectens]|uniref:zinc finger protein 705F-like isoform X2 n=1 Tax=Protopterus annectens TaxID=7888 RepID=UPI001CFB7D6E|nr:zinc finger protein 705F-like isoform X2 [Protopterus annectens]
MMLEVPEGFEDVAVGFSREEWDLLSEQEKELHREVMVQNFENMISVGYNIPVDQLWLFIKKHETILPGDREAGKMVQQKQLPDNSTDSIIRWTFSPGTEHGLLLQPYSCILQLWPDSLLP